MNRAPWIAVFAILLVIAAGCEEDDERLAQYAEQSTRQQAGQNREMTQLNREVAQSHKELVGLQHDLEGQQVAVNHQRDQLESERREIAKHRHRDPIIAAAISYPLALRFVEGNRVVHTQRVARKLQKKSHEQDSEDGDDEDEDSTGHGTPEADKQHIAEEPSHESSGTPDSDPRE